MSAQEKAEATLSPQESANNPALLFDKYAEKNDTDVLFFNGTIDENAFKPNTVLDRQQKRKHLLFILVTLGGDPHAAYRLMRRLQASYEKITLLISGQCKSAGTLVAMGAHELVFGEFGELGPLDIQLFMKDEPLIPESGLTMLASLRSLQEEAFKAATAIGSEFRRNTRGIVSLETTANVVSTLIGQLYTPLFKQLDPGQLGAVSRALKISEEYGKRLIEKGRNLSLATLTELIMNYPTHAFVIDEWEARHLFKNVRQPDALEKMIVLSLGELAIKPTETPVTLTDGPLLYLNREESEESIQSAFGSGPLENAPPPSLTAE